MPVSRSTVVNVLKEHGIDPGPKRGEGTWSEFVRRHAATLYACDFFSKKVVTFRGITEVFVVSFIHIGGRRVHVAGMSRHTTQAWCAAPATEAAVFLAGQGGEPAILLRDRDTKFNGGFDAALRKAGVGVKEVGPQAPNLNAFAERWVQSVKEECLDHFIAFGESHLKHILGEYLEHYNRERPHQGVCNRTLSSDDPPPATLPFPSSEVVCEERLGGLLKHYRRRAA